MKKSTRKPWMSAEEYGQSLPPFTVNLLVRDVPRATGFYEKVLGGEIIYFDEDFAAIRVSGVEFMLHADHTYDVHPWLDDLASEKPRGLGTELRILGIDPDEVEASARAYGSTIVQPATTKYHGWREVMVRDSNGYIWAVGVSTAGCS